MSEKEIKKKRISYDSVSSILYHVVGILMFILGKRAYLTYASYRYKYPCAKQNSGIVSKQFKKFRKTFQLQ